MPHLKYIKYDKSTSAGEYIAGRSSKNLNYPLDWQKKSIYCEAQK